MTESEFAEVRAAAEDAGLSVPSFLVVSAMEPRSGAGLSIAQRRALVTEVLGVSRVLRRAAENLNRLTRIGQGQGSLPPEVPAAAEAVQGYLERFSRLVMELGSWGGAR